MEYKYSHKKNYIKSFIKIRYIIIILIVSAVFCITSVNINHIFNFRLLKNIDSGIYKSVLNSSFPIIDMIYNSGNISISFLGAVSSVAGGCFEFNIKKPITIFNLQSPIFGIYYNNEYGKYMKNAYKFDISSYKKDGVSTPNTVSQNLPQNESSISLNTEDLEKKDINNENIVSKGKLVIRNETKYGINLAELMAAPLKIKFNKKGPKVLIYHTHTTESYINDLSQLMDMTIPCRNDDDRFNVVRVGEELAQNFRKKYGIDVIHNATNHIYLTDYGAYERSESTAIKILKSYPSIQIILDIHRDGVGGDRKLREVTKVGGKDVARIMSVVGTDASGLFHPNWRENLKFALEIKEKLSVRSADLSKPVYLSKNRYNQSLSNAALTIEIGGDGNTLAEALESTKYLAEAINDVIKRSY